MCVVEGKINVGGVDYRMLPADIKALYQRTPKGEPFHKEVPRLWHGVSETGESGIFATRVTDDGSGELRFETHRIME